MVDSKIKKPNINKKKEPMPDHKKYEKIKNKIYDFISTYETL